MAPSPSAEERGPLLLDLAEGAIRRALDLPGAPEVPDPLPRWADEALGAFVTLTVDGRLNGCIGQIDQPQPLRAAIGRLAVDAALHDPRLPSLRPSDLASLEIEVSVLSPLAPIACRDRAALLDQLRPGTDGLLVAAQGRRAVFLPDVWDQLPLPDQFLDHLLAKAGLAPGGWPPGLQAWRFTTEQFRRRVIPPAR